MKKMTNRWYVKEKYPNDSIVAVFDTEPEALAWTYKRNEYHQSNNYYVEQHDPATVWDVDIMEFIVKYKEEQDKDG